jgi:hypothetical protein
MGTKRRQKDHEPPKHLSAEARQWWANVVEAFELEPHHLKVLRLAGGAQGAHQTRHDVYRSLRAAAGAPRGGD